MKTIGFFAVGAIAVAATACTVSPKEDSLPELPGSPQGETPSVVVSAGDDTQEGPVFVQTVVNIKDDGSYEVAPSSNTLAEQLAENELRRAREAGVPVQQTMGLDTTCAGTSNWMYDQPAIPIVGFPGQYNFVGNRVCINKPAFECEDVDLGMVPRGATFVCAGKTYQPSWAGGPTSCFSGTLFTATPETNFVRAVWTGLGNGVSFYTSAGVYQNWYAGPSLKHPDVSPYGRKARTCH